MQWKREGRVNSPFSPNHGILHGACLVRGLWPGIVLDFILKRFFYQRIYLVSDPKLDRAPLGQTGQEGDQAYRPGESHGKRCEIE